MAATTLSSKEQKRATEKQNDDVLLKVSYWRWVVAFGCFWMNFCLLGVQRSSAVIFVALVDTFGINREDAAWPSGVMGFCMCFTGVLSGFLSHHFSNRSIMMIGASAAAFGVSLCCCATDINTITILYGAVQGAGLGLIVPLTHVVLNQHFSRNKALAMGIAYAGSSVGSFVFPALSHWILEEFGLNGTFLLLGGIMLNSLLGISFFRKPEKKKTTIQEEIVDTPKKYLKKQNVVCKNKQILLEMGKEMDTKGIKTAIKNISINSRLEGRNDCSKTIFSENADNCAPKQKHDAFKGICIKIHSHYRQAIDILTNPSFIIIALVFALYFSLSAIFLMVILDYGQDLNLPKHKGVFLISVFSFGDLAGRLSCGWIADFQCLQRKLLVCGYLIGMGGLTAILPWCSSYETLVVSSLFLGVLSGSVMVNYSVLLTEYLGLQKLPMAIGFSTCIIGLTAFLRPLAIGYFRDKVQNYDLLFIYLGTLQIFFTCLWLLENIARKIWTKVFH